MRGIRSVVLSCAAAAVFPMVASAQERVQYNMATRLRGELATRPVTDGRFNGRLWVGRPIIGGPTQYSIARTNPCSEAYGADDRDSSMVYAKVGAVVVGLSPWQTVQGSGNHSLEGARQRWLEERGYTGGVRTFVNDLYLDRVVVADRVADAGETKTLEPRATIHMPIDQPRFKSRMQVKADDARAPLAPSTKDEPARISRPATAPAADTVTHVIASDPTPAATQVASKVAR